MESPAAAVSFTGALGIHRTFVPSRFGGILEVGCDQPAATIWASLPKVAPTDLAGNALKPAKQKFTLPVKPGEFGWFDVLVKGVSGSYKLWATFDEPGYARDGTTDNDDPLIPWNFWYFPFSGGRPEFTAWGGFSLRPCQHYETAFAASGVLDWEKANHNDPTGTALNWAGHCHNSAPASMIFKPPPDGGKDVNGVTLSCEEMKFLATEYFGRNGTIDLAWALPGTGPMGRTGFFQEHKPSDDPKRFGAIVGDLHKAFQDKLLKGMRPLLMDLRHSPGTDPAQVWNQAVYSYIARFWETIPHGDWLDLQVTTALHANADTMRSDFSSSGLPAKIVANGPRAGGRPQTAEIDTSPGALRRDQSMRYRVVFKDDGNINSSSPKNEWYGVTLDSDSTDLYAPRYIFVPLKPTGKPNPDGNPLIRTADVLTVLELRDGFK